MRILILIPQIKIDYRLRPAITTFPLLKGCIKKARYSNSVSSFVQIKYEKKAFIRRNKRFSKNSLRPCYYLIVF